MKFPVVAIASYPRSGNTWTRRLLWECASLRSGPVSPKPFDYDIAAGTALFEANDAPLVKTHELNATDFPAALLVVRNPLDAIDSYCAFNKEFGGAYERWETQVVEYATRWRNFHEHWLGSKLPLEIVRYRELARDAVSVMANVLAFLEVEGDPAKALDCTFERLRNESPERVRFYRRGRVGYGMPNFTTTQAITVLAICGEQMTRLGLLKAP